jgi:hypothetical protein
MRSFNDHLQFFNKYSFVKVMVINHLDNLFFLVEGFCKQAMPINLTIH